MQKVLIMALVATVALATNAASIPEKNERQKEQASVGGYSNSPMLPAESGMYMTRTDHNRKL